MNVIVIGICPSRYKTQRKNHTLDRLFRWMSFISIEFFSFTNLSLEHQTELNLSSEDYSRLSLLCDYDVVIALGNKVSQVLSGENIDHYKMPHPSPLNRNLNSKEYEMRVLNDLKEYIQTKC